MRDHRPSLAARAVFVLVCGVALAIPIARADAQTIDGLEGKIADARDRGGELNDQIESNVVELAEARSDAERAAGREAELSQVLAEGEERSAELARRLEAAEAELAATQERFERAQAVLARAAGRDLQVERHERDRRPPGLRGVRGPRNAR